MLKFNIKEHKLEELEKYGFKEEIMFLGNIKYFFYNEDKNKVLLVISRDCELIMFNDLDWESEDLQLSVLYDLIKDDLIIKE